MTTEINESAIDWSNNRLLPAFQRAEHLDVYDMRGTSYDIKLSVATLVGIINRPQPSIYLLDRANDAFWLKECFSDLPQSPSPLRGEDILKALLSAYRPLIKGLVIYDANVIDSVNIATMLAGQQDGFIVSSSLAAQLQQEPYNLPVLADLNQYHWKSRLQAYRWAEQNLLPHASRHIVAGLNPTIPLAIRSFLVATRAFIYWLDPLKFWPDPSVEWLSERSLMQRILKSFPPGATYLGWFVQEGSGVTITSKAALPVICTDLFSNLELWTSIPLSEPLPEQGAEKTPVPSVQEKVYVSFTMSEGDNLQYIQERLIQIWRDPARGSIPIGWATAPALIQAAPRMANYYARSATANDEFIAGPSGAGYMYPSDWPAEHLPPFLRLTGDLMQQMKLTVLEVLDSNFLQNLILMYRAIFKGSGMALINTNVQQRFVPSLLGYGVRGVLSGGGQDDASWQTLSDVLLYQNIGIASSVDEAVSQIKGATKAQRPYCINLYVLAWQMGPTQLKQVMERLGSDYEVVTPGTLIALLKQRM